MVVMKSLGGAGIVISLVSAFLVLALLAELYYLLWWKQHHRTTVPTAKRRRRRRRKKVVVLEEDDDEEESNTTTTTTTTSPAKELLHLFCWKKPTSLTPQHINNVSAAAAAEDYSCPNNNSNISNSSGIEAADFARLRSLSAGLPRFLFTIKEETKEDLESENGSGKGSRGRSMSADMVLVETTAGTETPYLTPLSSPAFFTPPLTPVDKRGAINPLFESFKSDTGSSRMKSSSSSSPPPKFKFMRDAEEKLYRKILTEEAMRVHRSSSSSSSPACSAASATTAVGTDDREDGSSFITIVIGKNRDEGQQQNQTSSTATHGKLISYFGANQ